MKTVKSPYLRNRLTDFDEIWHGDADCRPPPTGDTPLKFRIFQKQDGGGRHLEKPHKGDWQIFAKFGMIMQNGSLKHPDS